MFKNSLLSNLKNRRLSKIARLMAQYKSEKEERIALEELAEKLKNKNIKEWWGQNYILRII